MWSVQSTSTRCHASAQHQPSSARPLPSPRVSLPPPLSRPCRIGAIKRVCVFVEAVESSLTGWLSPSVVWRRIPATSFSLVPGRGLVYLCHILREFEDGNWSTSVRLSPPLPRLLRQVAVCHSRQGPAQLCSQLRDHLRVQVPTRPNRPRQPYRLSRGVRAPSPPKHPGLLHPTQLALLELAPPGCRTSRVHQHARFPRKFRQDRSRDVLRVVVQRMHRHLRQHRPRLVPAFTIVCLRVSLSLLEPGICPITAHQSPCAAKIICSNTLALGGQRQVCGSDTRENSIEVVCKRIQDEEAKQDSKSSTCFSIVLCSGTSGSCEGACLDHDVCEFCRTEGNR